MPTRELSPLTCFKKNCGHEACRQAWNDYHRNRNRQRAYGRVDRSWVDAEPVRRHVLALSAAGMGELQVAAASGIKSGTLRTLLRGDKRKGTGPTKRIRRWRADALLAVQPAVDTFADGARIDATGTRRRLQALAAIGWPTGHLAEVLHRDAKTIARIRSSDLVTARTARDVRNVYDDLWDQAPPEKTFGDRNASARARNLAARNGWPKPMDWDDIDDPQEVPVLGAEWNGIDPIAVERALSGEKVNLSRAEVAEVVRIATEQGMSASKIAKIADLSTRTIQRRRAAA